MFPMKITLKNGKEVEIDRAHGMDAMVIFWRV